MEGTSDLRRLEPEEMMPQRLRDTEKTQNRSARGRARRDLLCASVPLWLVLFSGCSYAKARLEDFGDIFRLEGHAGYGLQAHANVGELFHLGAGSSRQWSAGWI